MEVLNTRPYLVVDSAMNGDSAEKLVEALTHYFPGRKIRLIFGASSDHPVDDMLSVFLPAADQMIVTASSHNRAETPENLVAFAAKLGYKATAVSNMLQALDKVLLEAGQDDLICATGSLFLVADAREAWFRRNNMDLPPIDPIIL